MNLELADSFMCKNGIDGWLLYDFRGSNPIFWEVVGGRKSTTRRCFLLIPQGKKPVLIAHKLDVQLFEDLHWRVILYADREQLLATLKRVLRGYKRLAMEYSPECMIPYASRVDGGTLELVRKIGPEVVSSIDLYQLALATWDEKTLHSHLKAAHKINTIKDQAFKQAALMVKRQVAVTEFDIQQFILEAFERENLITEEAPIVAADRNSAIPHYEPTRHSHKRIKAGSWLLIDLWARERENGSVYADITWVGYMGHSVPKSHHQIFQIVKQARDQAFRYIEKRLKAGSALEGWEVDEIARNYIGKKGYGSYFTHRTGHSIGSETLHGNGVCLDNYETHDTRKIVPGVAFSIEPGIYRDDFGVRSEINVFVKQSGPVVTTPAQQRIIRFDNIR